MYSGVFREAKAYRSRASTRTLGRAKRRDASRLPQIGQLRCSRETWIMYLLNRSSWIDDLSGGFKVASHMNSWTLPGGRSPMATRFHQPLVATMTYAPQPSRLTTGIDSTIGSIAFIPRANQSGQKNGTKQAQSR